MEKEVNKRSRELSVPQDLEGTEEHGQEQDWFVQLEKDKDKWDNEKKLSASEEIPKGPSPIKYLYELSLSEWNTHAKTDTTSKSESTDFSLQEGNFLSPDIRTYPGENPSQSVKIKVSSAGKKGPSVSLARTSDSGTSKEDRAKNLPYSASVSQINSPESSLQSRSLSERDFQKPKRERRWFPRFRRSSTSQLSTGLEKSPSVSISKGSTELDESSHASCEQISQSSLITSSSSKDLYSIEDFAEADSSNLQEGADGRHGHASGTNQESSYESPDIALDVASTLCQEEGEDHPERPALNSANEQQQPRRRSFFFTAVAKRKKETKSSSRTLLSTISPSMGAAILPSTLPSLREAHMYSTRLKKAVQQLEAQRASVRTEQSKYNAKLQADRQKWKQYAQHALISMASVFSETLRKKKELEVTLISLAIDDIVKRGELLDKAVQTLQNADGQKGRIWPKRTHAAKGKSPFDETEENYLWLPEDFTQNRLDDLQTENSEPRLRDVSEIIYWALNMKQAEGQSQLEELRQRTERIKVSYQELCTKLGRSVAAPLDQRTKKMAYLVFCALQESFRMMQRAEHGKASSALRHFYLHPLQMENQLAFEAIVADGRTVDGKLLLRWEGLITKMVQDQRKKLEKNLDGRETTQNTTFHNPLRSSITKFRAIFVKHVIDSLSIVPATASTSPLSISRTLDVSPTRKSEKDSKGLEAASNLMQRNLNGSNTVEQKSISKDEGEPPLLHRQLTEPSMEDIYGPSMEEATRRTKCAVDLYVERLLFTRLANLRVIFPLLETEKEREWNKSFRRKANWLCVLTQEQVGIAPKFRAPSVSKPGFRKPYHLAIDALSKLTWMVVPSDIFQQIMVAMRLIHQQAQECVQDHQDRARRLSPLLDDPPTFDIDPSKPTSTDGGVTNASSSIASLADSAAPVIVSSDRTPETTPRKNPQHVHVSADDLFPLVCWVVIHAYVPVMHTTIGHLERFLPKSSKTFGEMAMCLTLLQAAVLHIGRMELDQFDFPDDIKEAIALAMQQNESRLPNAPLLGFPVP